MYRDADAAVAEPTAAVTNAAPVAADYEEIVEYEPVQPGGEVWGPGTLVAQRKTSPGSRSTPLRYHEIECLINDESSIACRRDDGDGEVFVPFSFVGKYFEVMISSVSCSLRRPFKSNLG